MINSVKLFYLVAVVSACCYPLVAQDIKTTNLLQSLDLKQGVIDGDWNLTDDGLKVAAGKAGRCVIASNVPSSYDLTIEFTRLTGKDVVALILPVGNVSPALGLSGWQGLAHGLSRVDGLPTKDQNNPTSVKPGIIVNGQRQKVEVSVRTGSENPSIKAALNGKVLFDWNGSEDRLEPNIVINLPNKGTLAVASRNGSVIFHRAELRSVEAQSVMKNVPVPIVPKTDLAPSSVSAGEIGLSSLGKEGASDWELFNLAAFEIVDEGGGAIARAQSKVGSGDRGAFVRGLNFNDGVIELELKGSAQRQASFLGVVFHAVDGKTYEAVYFRPFNFGSSDALSRSHCVQYIAHPDWPWQKLRKQRTGEYENGISPEPDGADWFRMRVEVKGDRVQVFVGDAKEPSLNVKSLSQQKGGKVGLWFNGIAEYRNLKIVPEN